MTAPAPTSLLTIVRGRESHLHNQLRGLLASNTAPAEWVVVQMDEPIAEIPDRDRLPFPIRQARVDGTDGHLPLAKARNRAASLATTDRLVFLDVDCIPSAELIERFDTTLAEDDRLWMGDVRYLHRDFSKTDWEPSDLTTHAVRHPRLPELAPGQRLVSDEYERFWSLCFGVLRATFDRIGGFDESFVGYGGEDTDLAFSAREHGVGFGFVGATAYHQHHPVCQPPLNNLSDILINARRFREKWNLWPMEGWLRGFADAGFVRFDPDRDHLALVQRPSNEQIKAATTDSPAGF